MAILARTLLQGLIAEWRRTASAATLSVNIGPNLTPGQIVTNIVGVLNNTIVYVGVAAFIVGALLYATSGGKDDRKSMGKDFMVGAVIGVMIVKSAKVILNLTMYFIYGS